MNTSAHYRELCHAQAFKGMRTGHRAFDNSDSSMMRRMERELSNEMKFMPDKFTDPLLDVGERLLDSCKCPPATFFFLTKGGSRQLPGLLGLCPLGLGPGSCNAFHAL